MSLRYFELGNEVLGFLTTTKIEERDLEEVHVEIKKRLENHNKIRIYCENASGEAMSAKASLEDLIFKLKFKDRFEKVAIVSDVFKDKLRTKVECTFLNSQCHFFKCSERTEALQWVVR
ncbi:STAS/SEC14 domain-containing protein [Leeuwenhoekiella parthenopeia]|uniref:STAS/SEC14 domain-containing protein n=1 Tax=Leeuwenhoekiella parthenopeia TaxID=2890320 RepID=A0ABS8GUV2_9FLAO|nr:STAS/SEC14 domain-containing protein [Leeuwenhoekiella parthenopeia]MCC4213558.1 STAS/SEC14 domain-containing protein [Leeuwenhoekiella parthenopeia]